MASRLLPFEDAIRHLQQGLQEMLAVVERTHKDEKGPIAAFVWLRAADDPVADVAIDYFILVDAYAYSHWPLGRISVPTDRAILCVPLDKLFGQQGWLRNSVIERIARDLMMLSKVDLDA